MMPKINPEAVIEKLRQIPYKRWKYEEKEEDKSDNCWRYEDGYRKYTSQRDFTKITVLNNFVRNRPLGIDYQRWDEFGTFIISIPRIGVRITGKDAASFFHYLESQRLKHEEEFKKEREEKERAKIKRLEESL